MKKILSFFSLAILAFVAVGFSSCGDDDVPAPNEKHFVSYKLALSENLFRYVDVTITVDNDGVIKSYPMDKSTYSTKVGSYELTLENQTWIVDVEGRVVQVPLIEYTGQPVKVTLSCKVTEAGKDKIAKATEDDVEIVRYFFDAGDCAEDGMFCGTKVGLKGSTDFVIPTIEEKFNTSIVPAFSVKFPLENEFE